jgi:hypothetical protein
VRVPQALALALETYWLDARRRIVEHYSGELSRDRLEGGVREIARAR